MQRMINTHIEASKIGRQIADQVLDYQRRLGDSSLDSSPEHTLAQMVPVNDPTLASTSLGVMEARQLTPLFSANRPVNGTLPSYNQMRSSSSSEVATATISEHGKTINNF